MFQSNTGNRYKIAELLHKLNFHINYILADFFLQFNKFSKLCSAYFHLLYTSTEGKVLSVWTHGLLDTHVWKITCFRKNF